MKYRIYLLLAFVMCLLPWNALSQVRIGGDQEYDVDYLTPKSYEIGGITFEGADHFDTRMVLMVAGLQVGDMVKIPGDKITTAVDNLWKQGLFEDVKISLTKIQDGRAFLKITLSERPKMSKFQFRGVRKGDDDKIKTEMNIKTGDVVTENLLTTTSNKIRSYYMEKGYTNVTVNTALVPDTADGKKDRVIVIYNVKTGKKVKIDSLIFEGNEQVPYEKLIRKMKNTHDVHYAKHLYFWTPGFWKKSKYNETNLSDDLNAVIDYYNELGYRDARIVMDTVWQVKSEDLNISDKKKAKQDRLKIKAKIYEGDKFYFRNITFAGNTIYTSEELANHLRIEKGDPYNKTTLETNLTYNPSGTDITSMYMDNGYLFFDVTPVEMAVENDSIDIEIRIHEGKQARVRNVWVEGNTVTNDKIIIRELHSRPGDLFSRDAVMRSLRELRTLGYFKEESIEPVVKPNVEDGTVDIAYKVEEGNTSQLTLQGGYGNRMFVGQVGVQLNNFAASKVFDKDAWCPLPQGDGQKLGVNLVSNGSYYYAINGSFTEPWLGGKNAHALSISVYHNLFSNGYFYQPEDDEFYKLKLTGAGISFSKRLKWPDDYFIFSHGLTFKHYTLQNYTQLAGNLFTDGVANDLSYSVTISRNSTDSPIYPRSGSELSIAGSLTPPYSLLSGKDYSEASAQDKFRWVEYYKINLRGSWMYNLVGDVVFNARFRFGFMNYYNSQIGLSPFGRYFVGGDGLSSWMIDGREVIPLRGYENNSISPASVGGSVFDRYTLELRQPIIESNATTIYVLGFLEGGNCWADMKQFQPFKMYNAAGLGIRLNIPMMGMIGIDWGYGFDGANGGSQFHFSIGQSID